jgi:FkbM family methyltransferase
MPKPSAAEYTSWFTMGKNNAIGGGEFFEYIIQSIYTATLGPGDVAFDGGAFLARHTIPMADLVGDSGLVVGFEAIPPLADGLVRRMRDDKRANVTIVAKAIGPTEGRTEFTYVSRFPAFSGRKKREGIPEGGENSIQHLDVPMTTMDRALRECGRDSLRFIKLDLEGGEYDALLGATAIMRNQHPLIVFENGRAMSSRVYGYAPDDWYKLFEDHAYTVFDLFGRPFGREHWAARPDTPWYFIAARRPGDLAFVEHRLPATIRTLYEPVAKVAQLYRSAHGHLEK